MTTYITRAGDDLETVSRRVYGIETQADTIRQANPGLAEPLIAGLIITVPLLLAGTAPVGSVADRAADPDQVAILIDGQRFRFWDSAILTRAMGSVSMLSFSAPWEPQNSTFRDIYTPMSFKPLSVMIGDELLFNGVMLTPQPAGTSQERRVTVTGYGRPGVLMDCTAPASAFPLEDNGFDLRQIAAGRLKPFGLAARFVGDVGGPFDRLSINPTTKIYPYLAKLAKQRNFVMGDSAAGELLFDRPVAVGNPVANLTENEADISSISPTFSPQTYYSHVTGLQGADIGAAGGAHTLKNPRANGIVRPYIFQAPDTLGAEIAEATAAELGRMLSSAVKYTIKVPSWRDPNGQLWQPNTTLTLLAPGAMIYSRYEFLIKQVIYSRTKQQKTAELTLILPGALAGKIPDKMPWE